MTRLLLFFAWAVSIAAPIAAADPAAIAGSAITEAYVAGAAGFLADDLLEGRGPGSRGDDLTRAWLAAELKKLGYAPGAADGSYDQKFDMVGINSAPPETWTFRAGSEDVTLRLLDDFIAAAGRQDTGIALRDAELVFAGYGIQAPEYRWDDFKGVDLRGKLLVIMNNDPDWDPKLFEGNRRLYYGRWDYKYASAARQGAAGVIIIHTTPSAGYPWQVVQTSWSGTQFELPDRGEPRIDIRAWTTEAAMRTLLKAAGHDLDKLVAAAKRRDFRPVRLGIRTSLDLPVRLTKITTGNVIGLLPGSDPELKDEVVIFTAHHDHLGIGKPDRRGDAIYNGALDNATGVAQVLAIARAFALAEETPRRSVMALFVAAEEQGLLGSAHYARNPTFPPGKIAATINFDGANVWGPTKDVSLIGFGKSTLDEVARRAAAKQGRIIRPEQLPDRGFYYRSDQFSFAKIGVPSLYFDTGSEFVGKAVGFGAARVEEYERERYHQPGDEIDPSWDWSAVAQDARLGFLAGVDIANAATMPEWTPGDEFEAARKAAIAGVAGE